MQIELKKSTKIRRKFRILLENRWSKPVAAGTDTMDTDTDLSTDTELVICIRIRGTRIRVSGRFGVPVSNTM